VNNALKNEPAELSLAEGLAPQAPQQPFAVPAPGGAGDPSGAAFWDSPNAAGQQSGVFPMTGSQVSAPTMGYSEIVHVEGGGASPRKHNPIAILAVVVVVALVGLAAWTGWSASTRGEDPMAAIADLVGLGGGDALPEEPASGDVPAAVPAAPVAAAVPAETAPAVTESMSNLDPERPANPYWLLPNRIVGSRRELGRSWTAAEEESWRAGLMHPFTWQRFKTVREVREARLSGSEAILWDALEERKFWTRMQAAMGLADFGIPINLDVVEKAIGDTRPDAVTAYFQRFVRRSTEGERYVLRQAVRVVNEQARVVILDALNRANDPLRDLYLAAAADDPGRRVQRFVAVALEQQAFSREAQESYLRTLIDGPAGAGAEAGAAGATPAGAASSPAGGMDAQPLMNPVSDAPSARPVDEGAGEPASPAEVEFYDIDSAGSAESG